MDRTEELMQEAARCGAEVVDWDFRDTRIKGLYCDGVIAVSGRLARREQAAVMAEELGHHLTASGDIIDQRDAGSRKQERRGRAWAYDRLIGLHGILSAYGAGCTSRYEAAEFLDVPEEMLQEAVDYYRNKYGTCARIGGYVIYFEPLGVMALADWGTA